NSSSRFSVGTVFLNSADFNVPDHISDLEGVVEHEITEVLGRTSGLADTPPEYNLLDLYRYVAPGQISTSQTDANVYFSMDGGATPLMYYNSLSGGDLGDWATSGPKSNPLDAFNYSAPLGLITPSITWVDIQEMQALGYTVALPIPSGAWLFATACAGFGLFGGGFKRRFPGAQTPDL
ncbi:MAG: hypothetical protein ABSB19_15350, partial [Methylomonas sp.]